MSSRNLRSLGFLFLFLTPAFYSIAEVRLIREDVRTGLELWNTLLGQLWIPKPGSAVIKHLEWEQATQKVYNYASAHVSPGDIVIDCGAHIGGFTRVALAAGAQLVVAIEPEKMNTIAFQRNFAEELKRSKVILVEKGVWDKTGTLSLHLSTTGDSHSVAIAQNAGKDQSIEVTTLDALAKDLRLPRVDFIKMDIEGGEQNALRGARQVLERWHPRMAISSYHKKGDPSAISSLIWDIQPGYLIGSKDRVRGPEGAEIPKVLFFY
jgi:FkbM family methyltransferase